MVQASGSTQCCPSPSIMHKGDLKQHRFSHGFHTGTFYNRYQAVLSLPTEGTTPLCLLPLPSPQISHSNAITISVSSPRKRWNHEDLPVDGPVKVKFSIGKSPSVPPANRKTGVRGRGRGSDRAGQIGRRRVGGWVAGCRDLQRSRDIT